MDAKLFWADPHGRGVFMDGECLWKENVCGRKAFVRGECSWTTDIYRPRMFIDG